MPGLRSLRMPSPLGGAGALMSRNGNGVPFGKIIQQTEMPGVIFRMTMPDRGPTAGEKTALEVGATRSKIFPLLYLLNLYLY